jgi:hypothetical protein
MKCMRCRGFMVPDQIFDALNTEATGQVWRCVSCGDVVDALILSHRQQREGDHDELHDVSLLVDASRS